MPLTVNIKVFHDLFLKCIICHEAHTHYRNDGVKLAKLQTSKQSSIALTNLLLLPGIWDA